MCSRRPSWLLKEAIQAFDGTVIVVSHDREFLDGLVSKVYEFADGKVREHLGGIYDFLQKKNLDSLADIGRMKGASTVQVQQEKSTPGKEDYEAKKELERRKRKAQKRIEDCEKEVERITKEIKEIEEWLATPGGAQNTAMFEAYGKLKSDLAAAENRWEEAMMEGENI